MRIFCLLLFIAGSLNSFGKGIHDRKIEKVNNMNDTIWTEGKIIKVAFKNKKDAGSKTVFEYRLKSGKKEYFIKYCEGKVTKDQLTPFVDKKIRVKASFKTGLFDVCPGEKQQDVQSRAGEYVVIFELTK